jgi:hypothetical protein
MTESVKVILRIRPLMPHEAQYERVIQAAENQLIITNSSGIGKTFAFDAVYGENSD